MDLISRLDKFKHEQQPRGADNGYLPRQDDQGQSLSLEKVKQIALGRVVEELAPDFHPGKATAAEEKEISARVDNTVNTVLGEVGTFVNRSERQTLVQDVLNEILGLGPIEPLIKDPGISEIMVNGPRQVFVERRGRIETTGIRFRDDEHVLHIIDRIISPLGRRIDETSPMVDARLPDGSRVNAIIPPLAVRGPTLTIRKFAADPYTAEDLLTFGTYSSSMLMFLKACVEARLNVVVSGGTGTGKTTTLNVLSSFIPNWERIVTIEDAAELQLQQEHVVPLEARPANIEGRGQVNIRELVINSLRMRPDRIVVGEARGGEALDMLQAMNTGHDGSLTTIHANSPRDALARIETMVLMAGMDLPVRAIREQVASGLHLIVHLSRFSDGTRKLTNITEVLGMESDTITLQDLFFFEEQGFDEEGRVKGTYRPSGIVPAAMSRFQARGISFPMDIFREPGAGTRR